MWALAACRLDSSLHVTAGLLLGYLQTTSARAQPCAVANTSTTDQALPKPTPSLTVGFADAYAHREFPSTERLRIARHGLSVRPMIYLPEDGAQARPYCALCVVRCGSQTQVKRCRIRPANTLLASRVRSTEAISRSV